MADRKTGTSPREEAPRDGAADTQDHHIGEAILVSGDQTRLDEVSDAIEEDLSSAARTGGVRAEHEFEHALELPYLGQLDHPEGLCRWPEAGDDAWLVVFDTPAPGRLKNKEASVVSDIVAMPSSDPHGG